MKKNRKKSVVNGSVQTQSPQLVRTSKSQKRKVLELGFFLALFAGILCVGWYFVFYIPPPEKIRSVGAEDFKDQPIRALTKEVRELITPYVKHPVWGETTQEVLAKLEQYDDLFGKAKQVSAGLRIDLILQDHGEAQEIKAQALQVVESQRLVAQALTHGHYDVSCVEGVRLDPITMEGLAQEIVEYGSKRHDQSISIGQARKAVQDSLPTSGFLQYLVRNPSSVMIGSEDESLNHLHRLVLDDFMGLILEGRESDIPLPKLDILNKSLSRLRSELAIAKIVLKLREKGGQRGVIIMGYAHDDDMIGIFQHLHVVSDVFVTNARRK